MDDANTADAPESGQGVCRPLFCPVAGYWLAELFWSTDAWRPADQGHESI